MTTSKHLSLHRSTAGGGAGDECWGSKDYRSSHIYIYNSIYPFISKYIYILSKLYIYPPWNLTDPLKIDGWKSGRRHFHLTWSLFRGHVNFWTYVLLCLYPYLEFLFEGMPNWELAKRVPKSGCKPTTRLTRFQGAGICFCFLRSWYF